MRTDERWTAIEANECIEEKGKGCKRKACLNCGLSLSWKGEMPPTGDVASGGCLSSLPLPLCLSLCVLSHAVSFPFPFFPSGYQNFVHDPLRTKYLFLCISLPPFVEPSTAITIRILFINFTNIASIRYSFI